METPMLWTTAIIMKGASYAVHNSCNPVGAVGAGPGEQLHDGRIYSPPARYRRGHGPGEFHPGTAIALKAIAYH